MPKIYNRMQVQVKQAEGRVLDLQQDESPGKAGRGSVQDKGPG
jgi:hypothetical protein